MVLVDVFEVNAGTPTQMDWFAHATAEGVGAELIERLKWLFW
jgi:hypothetical protein